MTTTTTGIMKRHVHGGLVTVDKATREIVAVLTTQAVDLQGDVIIADGVEFRSRLPLLVGHHPDRLAGEWGAPYRLNVDDVPGWAARGRFGRSALAEEAYQDVVGGFLSGVSISFKAIEADDRRVAPGQTGKTFRRILVLEASLTAMPACDQCRVTSKAFRAPAPEPLVLDRGTLTRLIRQQIARTVDERMPIFQAHLTKALLRAQGRID